MDKVGVGAIILLYTCKGLLVAIVIPPVAVGVAVVVAAVVVLRLCKARTECIIALRNILPSRCDGIEGETVGSGLVSM